jgi:hypothetical protein
VHVLYAIYALQAPSSTNVMDEWSTLQAKLTYEQYKQEQQQQQQQTGGGGGSGGSGAMENTPADADTGQR